MGGTARRAEAPGSAEVTPNDKLAALLLYSPLIATTFLSKIAISSLSSAFTIAVPILIATPLAGLMLKRMRFDLVRLSLYLIVVALLWAMQVFSGEPFSMKSMLLMTTLFFTMTVYVPRPGYSVEAALVFFLNLATWLAVLGVAQFFLQFVIGSRFAFPIEHFLPKNILIQHYNYLNPLSYGVGTYKANGVFLLEPSQFSQLLAVAIVAELMTSNRLWRLALFAIGMVVSYSGTGLIVLAVCLPIVVVTKRRWDFLFGMCVLLAILVLFAEPLNLDLYVQRLSEFSSTRSSAFGRFVGGFYAFDDWLWPDWRRTFFGYGGGSYAETSRKFVWTASEMPLNKIVFEFGLVGAFALFGFFIYCMVKGAGPGVLRLALGLSFFLNPLYTPTSQGIALSVVLWNCARLQRPHQKTCPLAGVADTCASR
jgi:hypothetical protein